MDYADLLEDLEVLAGHLEAAGSTGFAMSVREAHAEVKRQNDGVVTSDGRTVTVREWLAENVARRRTAEAKLASIRATPFQQADPESGELAWASGYNAALKIIHNLAAEDER